MDPRHPELAIKRMRELMKQYDRVEKDMERATTSAQLGQLEREGGLVVQEICLVAPRIHEAMMQTSRQRRHDIARGVLVEPQDTAVELPKERPVEKSLHRADVVVPDYGEESYKVEELKPKEDSPAVEPAEEKPVDLSTLLERAKEQFSGKIARNKGTGLEYKDLQFIHVGPSKADSHKSGIIVSMRNKKEILSLHNEEVENLFKDFEPIAISPAKKTTKRKTTSKKKTTKKEK